MGVPLKEAILESTWNPAQMVHHPELGHLSAGATADIAIWKLLDGEFGFYDAAGGKFNGKQRLICEMTLHDGKIAWDWNAREAVDYRTLGPTYGIRPGIDHIVRPTSAR
jgi:dihydroorotase